MNRNRIALLSDIHATMTSLDAVLLALEQFAPLDAVVIAGDFTYGPSQAKTIARLASYPVIAVRGNGDAELLDYADGKSPAYKSWLRQFSLIRWTLETTDSASLAFLRDLPEQQVITLPGTDPIRLVHRSPRKIDQFLYPENASHHLEAVMFDLAEPVLVFGHTHQTLLKRQDNWLAINPGAVSMAIGKPTTAYFAVMDWQSSSHCWDAYHCTAPYDSKAITKEFVDSGLLDIKPLGPILLEICLTGTDVGARYMKYVAKLAKEAGFGDLSYVPDDIWNQAAKTYPAMKL